MKSSCRRTFPTLVLTLALAAPSGASTAAPIVRPALAPVADPRLQAELYRSRERAPDGHLLDLLYSTESRLAYMIRFDG